MKPNLKKFTTQMWIGLAILVGCIVCYGVSTIAMKAIVVSCLLMIWAILHLIKHSEQQSKEEHRYDPNRPKTVTEQINEQGWNFRGVERVLGDHSGTVAFFTCVALFAATLIASTGIPHWNGFYQDAWAADYGNAFGYYMYKYVQPKPLIVYILSILGIWGSVIVLRDRKSLWGWQVVNCTLVVVNLLFLGGAILHRFI